MKNQKLLKNLRHRLSLLLCLMAFLAVGQSAWAVDFYYWGWDNNSPQSGSPTVCNQKMVQNGNEYTYTINSFSSSDYCFLIFTTSSTIWNDVVNNKATVNDRLSGDYSIDYGNRGNISPIYHIYNSNKSAPVVITYNSNDKSLKATNGGSPTCTYYMKYPWNGEGWGWKQLSENDGVYTREDKYGGSACNINTEGSGDGPYYSPVTVVGSPATGDDCIFSFTPKSVSGCPTGDGTVTITKKTSATAPTVRLGEKPEETGSYDVNVSAYVAATGCADITKFTVYYSKSSISSTSGSGVYKKDFSQSAPALGSITQLILPSADLATNGWSTGGDLYIRITGTNSAGESELSDEIKLSYTVCAGIITSLVINPSSTQLTVNTPQTFTYTANDGATVNSVQWYKNDVQVSTDNSYTFTPTTGDSFTIGLKAFNTSCNPDGFDAETQTYTVCVPIGDVTITNCPSGDVQIGQELTISATLSGTAPAESWVWTVNGAEQEVTVDGLTSSITYTPQSAIEYTVIAKATDCTGAEKTDVCNFVVKKAFTANNLNKTFSACAGGHQFNWADMFTPTPDSWSAAETTGGADATALFTLKNGIMTWNNADKASGDYSYTFTAVKEGYKNATAVLTFSYTEATKPAGTIGEIIVTGTPTYPWTKVNLQCTVEGSGITNVVWSSSNSGLVVSTGIDGTTATAYFKGKVVRKDTEYTVTAVGQSETCGSTASQTITITVKPEEEEICY